MLLPRAANQPCHGERQSGITTTYDSNAMYQALARAKPPYVDVVGWAPARRWPMGSNSVSRALISQRLSDDCSCQAWVVAIEDFFSGADLLFPVRYRSRVFTGEYAKSIMMARHPNNGDLALRTRQTAMPHHQRKQDMYRRAQTTWFPMEL